MLLRLWLWIGAPQSRVLQRPTARLGRHHESACYVFHRRFSPLPQEASPEPFLPNLFGDQRGNGDVAYRTGNSVRPYHVACTCFIDLCERAARKYRMRARHVDLSCSLGEKYFERFDDRAARAYYVVHYQDISVLSIRLSWAYLYI